MRWVTNGTEVYPVVPVGGKWTLPGRCGPLFTCSGPGSPAHRSPLDLDTPAADPALALRARQLDQRLRDLAEKLTGDEVAPARNEPSAPSIADRVGNIVQGHWTSSSAPTRTLEDDYAIAAEAFAPLLQEIRQLIEGDLAQLQKEMETAGAPWTPGRVPTWQPE